VISLRIKSALFLGNFPHVEFPARDANSFVELQPLLQPVIEQPHPLLCPAKIFQLHLLELARAKREITRINLVPKRFADLRYAEWQFLARHFQNGFELYKNGLS